MAVNASLLNRQRTATEHALLTFNLDQLRVKDTRESFSRAVTCHYLGNQIKRMRMSMGMNQREFAEYIGMNEYRISALERGRGPQSGYLSIRTLLQIADALDCCLEVSFVPFSHYTKLNALGKNHPSPRVPEYREDCSRGEVKRERMSETAAVVEVKTAVTARTKVVDNEAVTGEMVFSREEVEREALGLQSELELALQEMDREVSESRKSKA